MAYDVQAYNTIIVTGNLTASSGVTVNLIANEVILQDGATLGPGVNIRLGIPTSCGNPISQFPIANLGAYCTTGAYNANTLRNAPIVEEVEKEELPSITFFNTPNPFIESTNLRFDITTDDEISIVVYDILGQAVATVLQPTALSAGSYAYTLDGSNLSTGVYLATIQSHSETQLRQTIKIVKQ